MTLARYLGAIVFLVLGACRADDVPGADNVPDIIASNAFYYYDDVEAAWTFYRDGLGFETVVDYGFAKILRLADSSYLTLVAAKSGMHSASEPKTVKLTLLTDDLEFWRVRIRSAAFSPLSDAGQRIVIRDPGGYLLLFEQIVTGDARTGTPASISPGLVNATEIAVYFDDMAEITVFYEGLFAIAPVAANSSSRLYGLSATGFLRLIEGADDLLAPTEQNGVTLSFLSTDVHTWYRRAASWPGFRLRTDEVLNEGGLVEVFVGYDPAGIFLEWDTFLDVPENAGLLRYLP